MPTGQAIFLAVLGVLFIGLAVYVLIIRPRKQRRLPPPRREREQERERPREFEAEEPELDLEPESPAPAPKEAPPAESPREVKRERKETDAVRDRVADAEAAREAEAERRRRDADERRRRAEAERKDREERVAERRRAEAERRRKADEERRSRLEAERLRREQEESRKRAEEDNRRQAEEAEARRKAEEVERRRERLRRLKEGLHKTRDEGFVGRLGSLLGRKELDEDLLGDLEEIMLTADIGVSTADTLFQRVKEGLSRHEIQNPAAVFSCLKQEARRILDVGAKPVPVDSVKPYVIMVVGVNGSGKTTTIGKLAARYRAEGKSVVLGAGDTFRAAATEQLGVWADRVGAQVVRGQEKSDPAAVLFNAVKEAQEQGADVVIADTAGRLQTKIPLMEELKKIRRVLTKAHDTAPHEVLLVLDSTNGQNAISQARLFNEALEITGFVLTKLDGTAKGGVILGICDELKLPIRYIGIGESVEDLREFDSEDFLEALFEIDDEAASP